MQPFWLSFVGSALSVFGVLTFTAWEWPGLALDLLLLAVGVALVLTQRETTLRRVGQGIAGGAGLLLAVMIGMYAWISLYMNGVI